MSTLVSSIDRPLAMRLRPDLIAMPVEMGGARTWIIRDPLTLEHFHFSPLEYALLDRLREGASIRDLQRTISRHRAGELTTPEAIWSFVGRLHESGLLLTEAAGAGQSLLKQTRREKLRRAWLAWTHLLAIRFPGINPDAALTKLHRLIEPALGRFTLLLLVLVVLYAGAIVVAHFAEFRARLPGLSALGDPRNLVALLLTIGAIKVVHELAHGLTCKHFGGRVHELGFMLLAFSPCLYCDVSDAWGFRSRWQRLAVSSAGIAVEIVLAAIATIVWWHSRPGLVNLIALNVMVVASVGTLLINGNPLLRYDGYYILSDLVGAANLWQRSREALRRCLGSTLLGEATPEDPLSPAQGRYWLALYGLASTVYITILCAVIVWGLMVVLHPLRLDLLAYLVGATMLGGALVAPISGAVRLAGDPTHGAAGRRRRLALATAVALAAAVALLLVPVDYHVRAPLVVMPSDAARIYASVDGTLTSTAAAGTPVAPGDAIAQLASDEVSLDLAKLTAELRTQELRLTHLERLRAVDPEASAKIPAARASAADIRERLRQRRAESDRLTLTAPRSGTIIPAPRAPKLDTAGARLALWSGSLLDPVNRGARVEGGTLVCLVGDPNNLDALLLVDDADIKRVHPGQQVRMRIAQLPGEVVAGEVVDVARHEIREDNSDGATRADLTALLDGIITPGDSAIRYQVRVRLLDETPALVGGGRGSAKIAAERITLGRWIVRWFAQTFRLPM